jgi:hypothetical protein
MKTLKSKTAGGKREQEHLYDGKPKALGLKLNNQIFDKR